MGDERQRSARVAALLDDLLRLDQEAVEVYTAVIDRLENERHHDTLVRFRGDHQRHIIDLCRLIRERGGAPTRRPAEPEGTPERAVQAAGGDREVLRALRANERRLRARYALLSHGELPPDVARVVARNAADEARHHAWVSGVLRAAAGKRVGAALPAAHAPTAGLLEGKGEGGRRLRPGA